MMCGGSADCSELFPLNYARLHADLSEFESRIGYAFQSRDLLKRALTHKSYSHEAKHDSMRDNETFEFLGDSVLGFVIGDLLFRRLDRKSTRLNSSHVRISYAVFC